MIWAGALLKVVDVDVSKHISEFFYCSILGDNMLVIAALM